MGPHSHPLDHFSNLKHYRWTSLTRSTAFYNWDAVLIQYIATNFIPKSYAFGMLLHGQSWLNLVTLGGRFLLFLSTRCSWRLSMQRVYKFGHLSIHQAELRLCSLGQLKFHLIACRLAVDINTVSIILEITFTLHTTTLSSTPLLWLTCNGLQESQIQWHQGRISFCC